MLDAVLYWLGRPILGLVTELALDMDVSWQAALPAGPKVIVANHPSTTDPFLVAALIPERVSILIEETLFKVPLFGRYLHYTHHVPVVRAHGWLALERGRALLEAGRSVVIFPEGSVSPHEGGFYRPHTGAARLALSTGAPVVPIGIHLQRDRIRFIETRVEGKIETGTWYLGGPYAMTVGKAMQFKGDVENRAFVRSVSEQIMQHIIRLAQQSEQRMDAPQQPFTPSPVEYANAV
ncbi:MAG: 1-acyl-sn-glycerol-3-phosphate acyltransferase [Anaerolineae bacterium]|nr:1-acyl-sn-glycerol-3-phosphate acyltransferase [Anaerolineae bacterium]